jgi:hypothetical protein
VQLINATRLLAGSTLAVDKDGRERLVVVVKGTFRIPTDPGTRLAIHEEQMPLVMSDVYFGDPGLSAPKYEVDFAQIKGRCDILLNGSAHAPNGRPAERVTVGLKLGSWSKSFSVVGDRVWYTAGGPKASSPAAFVTMPIDYDHAFGGSDLRHEDPGEHAAFMANPSGRGFHKHLIPEWLEGSPLPNTEELGVSIDQPGGSYRPMSFGPVARHWEPRCRFAGTYDQNWVDNVFPFLPSDFDERYYQAAPADQQLSLPLGEQPVTLINLTPDGRRDFVLPHFEAPVRFFARNGDSQELMAPVDTVVIEPDLERVTMTWRVAKLLRKNIFEVAEILVGRKGVEWWQDREDVAFTIPIAVERMPGTPEEVDET